MLILTRLIAIALVLSCASCESDENRRDKATKVVKQFVANLPLDNYDALLKLYPNLRAVKSYWKLSSFQISNVTVSENKSVSIIGESEERTVMFLLEKQSGDYVITDSKGLSADFETPLYDYCKRIGCLGLNNYDKDVSRICDENRPKFRQAVDRIRSDIENSVRMASHNLQANYGYVSGDVIIENASRYSVPAGSYEIYIDFMDSQGNRVYTKAAMNFEEIPYSGSISDHIFVTNSSAFAKVGVRFQLKSDEFIERLLSKHAGGTNCVDNGVLE